MSSLLERYLAGEHRRVWAELVEMGAAVREKPLYSEAMAVARETMRRARHNIELLIDRLHALGYQFGYDWWDEDFRDMLEYDPPAPLYAHPQADIYQQLAGLEERVGPLPLSLWAWYEQVGAVNFVGMYPVPDPTDPDGFTCYVQFVESGARYRGNWFTDERCPHDLDPLFIRTLQDVRRRLKASVSNGRGHELDLAPDEFFKYGVSGGGSYVITVPNPAADAILEYEWHETTFVDYLRTCFRWGGFSGLECKTRRPAQEPEFLTRDLLPI